MSQSSQSAAAGVAEAHAELAPALAALSIEAGPEVLALWRDQARHGRDPLAPDALRRLARVADLIAARRERQAPAPGGEQHQRR